ncbi:MDR family MFS transporter [Sinomonas sp. P10A9]|uniref:MDR family MFS transporter n=1 Tax=Sinomonas puerhi TaxID=3238584 RepID=A0AB39L4K0_9MICC
MSAAPPPASAQKTPATRSITVAITVLVLAALVMILNETVLSVALPQLMTDFAVSAATAQWLTTGFMLTMAVVIPTTGYLLQRFSTRGLFATAILFFLAGTAIAAFAPTFGVMLVARVVQAFGTAIILPLLMTTTLHWVAPSHRGTVMGLNSVVISVAPAIGPTLAGVVMHSLNWRWIFGLLLPLIVILWILGVSVIRMPHAAQSPRLDALSVVLSAFGFGGLVYSLATIETLFEGSWAPVVAFVVGVMALTVFIRRQGRLTRESGGALLDLRPFRVKNFRVSLVVIMMAMGMMLGTVVVLPIYLQDGLAVSVLTTGLLLLPGGLIQGIISPIIGRVYDRIGPRPLVIPGAVLMAAGQWWFTTMGESTALAAVVAMHVLFSVGMAMVMTPLRTVSLGSLPRELYGHGSAIVNTMQQLAGAAGTALFVTALSVGAAAAAAGTGVAEALANGTHGAFILGGMVSLAAILVSLFVKRLAPHDDGAPSAVVDAPAAEAASV